MLPQYLKRPDEMSRRAVITPVLHTKGLRPEDKRNDLLRVIRTGQNQSHLIRLLLSLMSTPIWPPGAKLEVTWALPSGSHGDRWANSRELTSEEENFCRGSVIVSWGSKVGKTSSAGQWWEEANQYGLGLSE